jgi:hypothetical protein
MRLLASGEIIWDVVDGQEILGGAPLNFSSAMQRLGNSATFYFFERGGRRRTWTTRSQFDDRPRHIGRLRGDFAKEAKQEPRW